MDTSKRIAIGCDEAAYTLKEELKDFIAWLGFSVEDFGTQQGEKALYPDISFAVAQSVADGKNDLAILCCGTGIGMAITANKVAGIRAAQTHDTYSAERARKSNNAQIASIGARVVGSELAKSIVQAFLNSDFESSRSGAKVDLISHYEEIGCRRPASKKSR
ncbi:ribose 5-phosphate isomerase B [Aliamphritea hakodatensis]|uniref:ribose 5-phosphate isomerase B n=1 Tax=Aliamphritea hakodatensis TaxID=2895352 RepID=UPI0022FDA8EF|nr:ribose 5-phosphate isomerase B [Aliamphritea hakodatensis]